MLTTLFILLVIWLMWRGCKKTVRKINRGEKLTRYEHLVEATIPPYEYFN